MLYHSSASSVSKGVPQSRTTVTPHNTLFTRRRQNVAHDKTTMLCITAPPHHCVTASVPDRTERSHNADNATCTMPTMCVQNVRSRNTKYTRTHLFKKHTKQSCERPPPLKHQSTQTRKQQDSSRRQESSRKAGKQQEAGKQQQQESRKAERGKRKPEGKWNED